MVRVELAVYDLSNGMAAQLSEAILGQRIDGEPLTHSHTHSLALHPLAHSLPHSLTNTVTHAPHG
jgi:hypothetical protein